MEAVVTAQPSRLSLRASVGALARMGSSSLAGALLSAVSTKIVASVAGPGGIGLLATLQQTRQAALVAASINGQTAIVQGVSARKGRERADFLRTVVVLVGIASALVCASVLLVPSAWAQLNGLGAERTYLIRLLAPVIATSVALTVLTALLTAQQEIAKVAVIQLVSPLAMAILAYPASLLFRERESALVGLLALSSGISVISALVALQPYAGEALVVLRGRPWFQTGSTLEFFGVAASMFATGLLGSCALLVVRNRIIAGSGMESVGHFDAAWSVSMNQVTLILSSMQAFFLPALSRVASPRDKSLHVSQGLLLAALVVAPAASIIAALKPQIIATLYSAEFHSAAQYLRWTLLGDYFKVASWLLSLPMLAAADMRGFLLADVAAYTAFVFSAVALSPWFAVAEAASVAFLAMYAMHFVVCGALAFFRHGVRVDLSSAAVWLLGLALLSWVSRLAWEAR